MRIMKSIDRYQILFGYIKTYPNPDTICRGDCEGTGILPVKFDDKDNYFRKLWQKAEDKNPSDDDWHFVKCPECFGTGEAV